MVNRLGCLWHHTIISRNHKNHNISCFRTTGTHRRKRCVSWCVKESNNAFLSFNVICTNMLGNTTRFACCHLRTADTVE